MAPASNPAPRSSTAHRGVLGPPELTLPPGVRFPFREEVRTPIGDWADLVPTVAAALVAHGYLIRRSIGSKDNASRALEWGSGGPILLAERGCQSVRMLRPMRVFIYTLFGGVFVLGAFDFVVVGNPIVLLPWTLSAAAIASLFWYRWGRSFEGDVVVVAWRPGRPTGTPSDPSASGPPSLVWWGGRVRSELRNGVRSAAQVEHVTSLAGDLASVVRTFSARLAVATGA